jgi:hypothetical protein
MVIDTPAILAWLKEEPERSRIVVALEAHSARRVSAYHGAASGPGRGCMSNVTRVLPTLAVNGQLMRDFLAAPALSRKRHPYIESPRS